MLTARVDLSRNPCGRHLELFVLFIKILLYHPQVKYKGELKQPTSISDLPELKRVKENQKNISNVGTSQYLSSVFNDIKCVNMQMRELY